MELMNINDSILVDLVKQDKISLIIEKIYILNEIVKVYLKIESRNSILKDFF